MEIQAFIDSKSELHHDPEYYNMSRMDKMRYML